ncbi:sensor histidine kinase [Desulfonema limicola]|nr:histidine kinase dimerization/phospho-acceptor domain-containing protein [Desulfonema limicola]
MVIYWTAVVEPRLKTESQIVAKAMAQFRSNDIADALSTDRGQTKPDKVIKCMDLAIVLTNPATKTPFIKGIELEVDPDVVNIGEDTIISRGNVLCKSCYITEIPLYASETRELMGIAKFYMSMDFFRNLKNEMVVRFFEMSLIIIILISAVGFLTTLLIKPLNILSDYLMRKDAHDLSATPDLTGMVTIEIKMVKTAMDDLLVRAQAHALEINKAYTKLKNTQAQLVQTGRLASIGELAAGVAHELNQPLMVIKTTSQILPKYIDRMTKDQILDHMNTVKRNTERMTSIINHLRTFSRQKQAKYEAVDINKVINDAFLMIGQQLKLRNIMVEMRLDPQLPDCFGNLNQLEQVFLNLITNARDTLIEADEIKGRADPEYMGKLNITTRSSNEKDNSIEPTHKRKIHYNIKYVPPIRIILFCKFINQI